MGDFNIHWYRPGYSGTECFSCCSLLHPTCVHSTVAAALSCFFSHTVSSTNYRKYMDARIVVKAPIQWRLVIHVWWNSFTVFPRLNSTSVSSPGRHQKATILGTSWTCLCQKTAGRKLYSTDHVLSYVPGCCVNFGNQALSAAALNLVTINCQPQQSWTFWFFENWPRTHVLKMSYVWS